MKTLFHPDTVSMTKDEGHKLLRLTEVSKWGLRLTILTHLILFLMDWGFDVFYIMDHLRNERWLAALATISVLIFAGIVTSVYYWFNEEWIDPEIYSHGYKTKVHLLNCPLNSQIVQASATTTENGARAIIQVPHSSNSDGGETIPLSVHYSATTNQALIEQSSDEVQVLPCKPCNCHNKVLWWKRFRKLSRLLIVSPVFRSISLMLILETTLEDVPNDILKRNPTDDFGAMMEVAEARLNQAYFNMIETFFEAIPQTLLQIYLSGHLTFHLESFSDRLIFGSIVWSTLAAGLAITRFNSAYHYFLKLARIKDTMILGGEFNKKSLQSVKWITTFSTFGFSLVLIVTRTYGLANILVTWGLGYLAVFFLILYTLQYAWLEKYPSNRMFYENSTCGIAKISATLVDRWINVFTFHQIRPSWASLACFHGIFIFTFMTFNYALTLYYKGIGPTQQCDIEDFLATCTLALVMKSQAAVLIGLVSSYLASALYLKIKLTKDKDLLDVHYPILKGMDFWKKLAVAPIVGEDGHVHARNLCLCAMASLQQFPKAILNCFQCRAGTQVDVIPQNDFDVMWANFITTYEFDYELGRISDTELRRNLPANWAELKRVKGQGRNPCLGVLNSMLDPLFDLTCGEKEGINMKDLQFLLMFYDRFELFLSKWDSYRVGKMFVIFGGNRRDECSWTWRCLCQ